MMDETRTRRQQQEDVVKLVTSSSDKRAKLQRLVEERKQFEASLAKNVVGLKRGVNSTPMSPSQPGVRVVSHKTGAQIASNTPNAGSSTSNSGWVFPTRAKNGNVPSGKKQILRQKWVDGINVGLPIESKGTLAKISNDRSVEVFKRGSENQSLHRPAPTTLESQAGKPTAEDKKSEPSLADSADIFKTKPVISGVYNPSFSSKLHGPPSSNVLSIDINSPVGQTCFDVQDGRACPSKLTTPQSKASESVPSGVSNSSMPGTFPDEASLALKTRLNTISPPTNQPIRLTKTVTTSLRAPDAVDDGFDVVGTAELEPTDGFDRLEMPAFSADNGKGELTFWEDEEDEEEWFEGWDEGGLADPKVKAGIDGRKGREVRFMSGL